MASHCHQVWPTDANRNWAGIDIFRFDEAGRMIWRPHCFPVIEETKMPKGYWIARVDVSDFNRYRETYVRENGPVFAAHGARFLVRGGGFENPEGSSRTRNVVLEFPSYQAALDCYHSPEYQRLVSIRAAVSSCDLVIVEGYDGPQPAD